MLASSVSAFNVFFFSFPQLAGIKEEAGSPADSKQEVFWCWLTWSLSVL